MQTRQRRKPYRRQTRRCKRKRSKSKRTRQREQCKTKQCKSKQCKTKRCNYKGRNKRWIQRGGADATPKQYITQVINVFKIVAKEFGYVDKIEKKPGKGYAYVTDKAMLKTLFSTNTTFSDVSTIINTMSPAMKHIAENNKERVFIVKMYAKTTSDVISQDVLQDVLQYVLIYMAWVRPTIFATMYQTLIEKDILSPLYCAAGDRNITASTVSSFHCYPYLCQAKISAIKGIVNKNPSSIYEFHQTLDHIMITTLDLPYNSKILPPPNISPIGMPHAQPTPISVAVPMIGASQEAGLDSMKKSWRRPRLSRKGEKTKGDMAQKLPISVAVPMRDASAQFSKGGMGDDGPTATLF